MASANAGARKNGSLKAKKSLGQNWLVDTSYIERILSAAELAPTDTVLEIGPGAGALTRRLAEKAGRVVAVEIDPRFVAALRQELAPLPNVQIVEGDILELEPGALVQGEPYVVVANLPYYITSPILRHLLEAGRPPQRALLMVQKEVAQRICAAPGDLSILGVSVQFYAQPRLEFTVPPSAFRPPPNVESAVVRLDLRPAPAVPDVNREDFFRVVRAGFGQKRKQLANSLSAGLALPKERLTTLLTSTSIDPQRRAETLSLDEWGALTHALYPGWTDTALRTA